MNNTQNNTETRDVAEVSPEQTLHTEIIENEDSNQASQDQRPARIVSPRASVHETAEEVVLEVEMPGAQRDSIQILVENDELSISGNRLVPDLEGYTVLHQERASVSYRRSFILSDRIATGEIAAAYQDGVLRLTLPKAAQAKPRRIEIQ